MKNNAADEEDMAMPLDKKRELPKWMVGSSKRVDVSPTGEKSPSKPRGQCCVFKKKCSVDVSSLEGHLEFIS